MRNTDIKDSDIPGADPAAVVEQYEPLTVKLAQRYIPVLEKTGAYDLDDLCQVGRMAIIQAQQEYNPAGGASFMTFIYNRIRGAMRRALGFNDNTGAAPAALAYLEETIPGTDDLTLGETLTDPDALPLIEPIIDAETREETAAEVRAAVSRLKSEKQREIIQRVYFDGATRKQAAADIGIEYKTLYAADKAARVKLRRDARLINYLLPAFSVSIGKFRQTFTSAVEAAVIWKEEHEPQRLQLQQIDNQEQETEPARTWSAARLMAYDERRLNKTRKETAQRLTRAEQIRAVFEQEHAL